MYYHNLNVIRKGIFFYSKKLLTIKISKSFLTPSMFFGESNQESSALTNERKH